MRAGKKIRREDEASPPCTLKARDNGEVLNKERFSLIEQVLTCVFKALVWTSDVSLASDCDAVIQLDWCSQTNAPVELRTVIERRLATEIAENQHSEGTRPFAIWNSKCGKFVLEG
jgi:hypothetical protein